MTRNTHLLVVVNSLQVALGGINDVGFAGNAFVLDRVYQAANKNATDSFREYLVSCDNFFECHAILFVNF